MRALNKMLPIEARAFGLMLFATSFLTYNEARYVMTVDIVSDTSEGLTSMTIRFQDKQSKEEYVLQYHVDLEQLFMERPDVGVGHVHAIFQRLQAQLDKGLPR